MSFERPEIENALIIGATGEAGQSALDAIRNHSKSAHIIGTTRSEKPIEGADETLHGISIDNELTDKVKQALGNRKIDLLVYTPALGEPGFPIEQSSETQWKEAAGFSFYPMLALEKELQPALTVGYSALYWLPHTLAFYGALGYVKKAMEEWCLASPESRALVRGGTFFSKSVRGISLLLQRIMKTTENPEIQRMKSEYESSGQKFLDFFLDYASRHEKEALGKNFDEPYRRTDRNDLCRGLEQILNGDGPIVSVVGNWTWNDSSMPELPSYFDRFGYQES